MSQYQKCSTNLKPFFRPTIDDLIEANTAFEALQVQQSVNNNNDTRQNNKTRLKRALSMCDVVFFGICLTVGSGVYVLTGILGKNYSGPAIIFTHIIASLSVGTSALGYIEFSSRMPVIGGSYTYVIASSGELIGFINGFCTIIGDPVSSSVNTIGSINYLKSFLEVIGVTYFDDNNYWTGRKLFNSSWISLNLSAPILNTFLCILCLFGIKLSSKFMNLTSMFNMSLIVLFIIAGLFYIDSDNWFHPCDNHKYDSQGICPSNASNGFIPFGIYKVIVGCTVCLWSYTGIEQIPTLAEECKNPTKSIPKAILTVWLIMTTIYVVLSFILLGMIPFQSLDTDAPLANAFKLHNNHILECIVSFGAFSTILIGTFANIVSSPRVLYRISVDGFMCKIFQHIDAKFKTPSNCIYLFMLVSTFSCAFFNLQQVVEWSSIMTLFQYICVLNGVLILRYAPPSIDNKLKGYYWSEQKILYLSWSYFVLCLLICQSITNRDIIMNISQIMWYSIVIILGVLCLIEIGIFIYLHRKYPWNNWLPKTKNPLMLMPLSPYLPCIVIWINCYIITTFSFYLFIQAFAVMIAAIIAYFAYGYKHGIVLYTNITDIDKTQSLLSQH